MKRIYFFLSVIISTCTTSIAQVTVSGSTGADGSYTTLTDFLGAFDAINNNGPHTGNNILITISDDISEHGFAKLFEGDWASLTINPAGGVPRTLTTFNTQALINLNGADNVTIDGLNSGGNMLTLINGSVAPTANAILFENDATYNTITRCTLLGSNGDGNGGGGGASGIIAFRRGIFTGNNNNTVTQCNISSSVTGPAIVGIGSSGMFTVYNSNNIISGNNISDIYHPNGFTGINIGFYNSNWTITNNRIYQTVTRIFEISTGGYGIYIQMGEGYTITGNFIGFANAAGTGTTNIIGLSSGSLGGTFPSSFTAGGTANASIYIGINCGFTAGGVVSSIQNNTIGGIALYTSSASTATTGMLCGIAVTSGNADVGTITGNTIGSASGASSIYVASTSAGGVIAGIYCTSANTINIQNNTIGGIDASGTTVAQATGFKGIDIAGTGTFIVSNNNVGNATANNIRTGYLLTGANLSNTATTPTAASGGGVIRGIVSSVTGATVDISNNIIRGIQISGNASTYTGISSTGNVTTTMNINANQVGTAGTNAVTFAYVTGGTVHGINIFPNAGATINLNNNSIYGITCPGANSIAGIITSGGTATATLNINNNSFTNNVINGVVSTPMAGITNSAIVSALNITGNIIKSNSSTATSHGFTGIQNSAAVLNTINMNSNTFGSVTEDAVTFTNATSGAFTAIGNTGGTSTATLNINSNTFNRIKLVSTGQFSAIINTYQIGVAVNMNNNQLGTASGSFVNFSGAQNSNFYVIYNNNTTPSNTCTLTMQANNIQGIVQAVSGTGNHKYISSNGSVPFVHILNNTFTNLSVRTTGTIFFMEKAGALPFNGLSNVNNNSIVGTFSNAGTAGIISFFAAGGSSVNGGSMTETGNNFSNVTVAGSAQVIGWQNADGFSASVGPAKTISNNTFSNISGGNANKTIISVTYGNNVNCFGNTVSNISGSANIIGIHSSTFSGGAGTHNYYNNTISNLITNGSSSSLIGIVAGSGSTPTLNVNGNTVNGLTHNGNSSVVSGIAVNTGNAVFIYDNNIGALTSTIAADPAINGIQIVSAVLSLSVYRNVINNLQGSGDGPAVNGMLLNNVAAATVNNNFISELRTPNADFNDPVHGISVTSAISNSTFNLYYNSIYINASSTAGTFGSSGIYHTANATATTNALNLIDNIIVNTSTAKGSGVTAAFRRSGSTLANYAVNSDYNLFYAGTPSARQLIYFDGTNSDQTLAAYQARVSTRDANSISLMPTFISSTDLHLTPANCRIDGRGIPIGAVTDDIDLAVRNATTPDIGADEFTATTSTTLAGSVGGAVCEDRTISVTGTTYTSNACDLIARVLPSGAAPVAGKVNVCVTLDATQQYFNGDPYVQRHFDMEPTTSNQTTTSATITLYFTNAEFIAYNTNNPARPQLPTGALGNADPNRANVKVTQFHGAATTTPSSPGNYPGVRVLITPSLANVFWNGIFWSITFDVAGFSGFYVHSNTWNAPLPVTINYFTGSKQGSNHLLNWKVTCITTPRVTMTLERSSDSRNFTTAINSITADAVRCQQPFDYTDTDPLKGMNYYRLKIVDADGKLTHSTTVALLNATKGFDIISIAPNPVVTDNFKLNVSSARASKMDISIFDMQGRLVNRQTVTVIAGYNSLPLNISNLSSGTYTIQAGITDERSKLARFVKQ